MSISLLKFSLSSGALLFGAVVVFFSLAVGQGLSLDVPRVSQRKFYVGQEILPDHTFYPLAMVADRYKLTTAAPEEVPFIQVQYAFKRMEYAHKLYQRDKLDLAIATITKSQKYLNEATHYALTPKVNMETKEYIYQAYIEHTKQLKQLGLESTAINNLHQEGNAVAEQLRRQLAGPVVQ